MLWQSPQETNLDALASFAETMEIENSFPVTLNSAQDDCVVL